MNWSAALFLLGVNLMRLPPAEKLLAFAEENFHKVSWWRGVTDDDNVSDTSAESVDGLTFAQLCD